MNRALLLEIAVLSLPVLGVILAILGVAVLAALLVAIDKLKAIHSTLEAIRKRP